jgi:hypothetical protein
MLKTVGLFCVLLMAFGCAKKEEERPSFLFVITSKHGEVKQASDGSWELVLDHGDIEKVLAFSNRPYRIVKQMTAEQFKQMWPEGSNSFEQDPPNATVIINEHLQTVVLLNVRVEGTKTTFKIRSDGPQSLVQQTGQTQLFIDAQRCETVEGGAKICGCKYCILPP